jgi:UDP-3-O-[3-hydroxymyristoyl] glucosamine N-acyltransferase
MVEELFPGAVWARRQEGGRWPKSAAHCFLEAAMPKFDLAELAERTGARWHGDANVAVGGVCSAESPRPGCLAMAETAEHLAALAGRPVAAVLHPESLQVEGVGLAAREPRIVFAQLLRLFHPELELPGAVHPSAIVDARASIDPSAFVGPHCLIGPRAQVGPRCYLQAFVSIAEDAVLEPGCRLYAHAVVGLESRLGPDCRLEPWAQVGNRARLGAGVDLGAHSCIGHEAEVETGAKLDNLVVVGPRSRVGALSLLVGQSSVDRDAQLHSGVILAGQSMVAAEAELASGVQLGGRALAVGKLEEPGPYLGNPARPLKEEMRAQARRRRLGSDPSAD